MDRIKFSDWQEMAIKKDVEAIRRAITSHEPIVYTLCWEIVIALAAVIVDHLFDTKDVPVIAWVIAVFLAVAPVACVLIHKMIVWQRSIRIARSGVLDVKQSVDSFDNQITYWVMMSNSYSSILEKLSKDSAKEGQFEEMVLIYQEGFFYINKSIHALFKMAPVANKVFSFNEKELVENSLVSFHRLVSILKIMKKNESRLDKAVASVKNNTQLKAQKTLNTSYLSQLDSFLDQINAEFEEEILGYYGHLLTWNDLCTTSK